MTTRKAIQEKRQKERQRRRLYAILIVIGAVVIVLGFFALLQYRAQGNIVQPPAQDYPTTAGRTMGDPNAPVVLEEYGDFQCPHCQAWFEETEPLIVENYVKTGDVYFIFRNFPILGRESLSAAGASMCAVEQERFWDYHNILFANQAGANSGNFSNQRLVAFAEAIGMDADAFEACLNEDRYINDVQEDFTSAQNLGVTGTPGIIINGVFVPDFNYPSLSQQIEAALAASGN